MSNLQHQRIDELCQELRLGALASRSHDHIADRQRVADNLRHSIEVCDKKIEALIDLRLNGELTEAEFADKKGTLARERDDLRYSLEQHEHAFDDETKAADRLRSFAHYA